MKLDYIIKLGGSLLYDFPKTKKMLQKLIECRAGNFAVTIGSGILGEIYKDYIDKLGEDKKNIIFENSVRDFSSLQSINASILSALNSNYITCTTEEEVQAVLLLGGVPILDSRGFMDVFKDDIYQKGDVRAANLCNYFNCNNLIVITNVDGIYDKDPNKNNDSHIIKKISVDELKVMGRTSVDEGLAERIEEYNLTCYVFGVDGLLKCDNKINHAINETGTIIKESGKVYEKKI